MILLIGAPSLEHISYNFNLRGALETKAILIVIPGTEEQDPVEFILGNPYVPTVDGYIFRDYDFLKHPHPPKPRSCQNIVLDIFEVPSEGSMVLSLAPSPGALSFQKVAC
jgi:hypothetical protein